MVIKTKDLRTGDIVLVNGHYCVVSWKSTIPTKTYAMNVVADIIDSKGRIVRKTVFQAGIEYEFNVIRGGCHKMARRRL